MSCSTHSLLLLIQEAYDAELAKGRWLALRSDFDAETHRNILRQLNSLVEVTRLWEAEARVEAGHVSSKHRRRGHSGALQLANMSASSSMPVDAGSVYFRCVVYLRPDLHYYDPIDAIQLASIRPNAFLTPQVSGIVQCQPEILNFFDRKGKAY